MATTTVKKRELKAGIVLILGCMWAGKTTELMRQYWRYSYSGYKTLLVTHTIDDKHSKANEVVTHDGKKAEAVKVSALRDIESAEGVEVIFVDEGQFFEDLSETVREWRRSGKRVYVASLNADFNMEAFGQAHELVPVAERVKTLSAICFYCKDMAYHSKKITPSANSNIIDVGAADKYCAVCYACWYN